MLPYSSEPLIVAFVALGFTTWEIFVRRRGRRLPVRLLAVAGLLSLASGCWRLYLFRRGDDPSLAIVVDYVLAPLLVMPYVFLRADDEIVGDV